MDHEKFNPLDYYGGECAKSAEPLYKRTERAARYEGAQCNLDAAKQMTEEVPTIVRDLRRRVADLEQQRTALDIKLNWCRELLSIFN